jgi:hypothetical protein
MTPSIPGCDFALHPIGNHVEENHPKTNQKPKDQRKRNAIYGITNHHQYK